MNSDHEDPEIWDAGEGECFLYTESWDLVRELREELGHVTAWYYGRDGRTCAWQFRVPKGMVRLLRKRFAALKKSQEEITESSSIELQ